MNAVRQTVSKSPVLLFASRLAAFVRAVLLCGLAIVAVSTTVSHAQADPPNKPTGPIHAAQSPASPRPPAPSWSEFTGNFLISVEQETHPPAKPTVKTFNGRNLKQDFKFAWNAAAPDMAKELSAYLSDQRNTGGTSLYDIKVTFGKADDKAEMELEVDSRHKRFALTYVVSGNAVEFSQDVFLLPDPRIRIVFDMAVTVYIDCNGIGGKGPLTVTRATMSFRNVGPGGGDDLWLYENGVKLSLGGTDMADVAEKALQKGRVGITDKLSRVVNVVNEILNNHLSNPIVTPSKDSILRLVFTLSSTPPAAKPAAPKKR